MATVRFGAAELRPGPGRALVLVPARASGAAPVGRLGRDVPHGAERDAFTGGARARLDAPS